MKHPFLPTRPSYVKQVCPGAWQMPRESQAEPVNFGHSFRFSDKSFWLCLLCTPKIILHQCIAFCFLPEGKKWHLTNMLRLISHWEHAMGFSSCARLTAHAPTGCSGTHLSMETSIIMLYTFLSKALRYLSLQRFNAVHLSSIGAFSNFYVLSLLVKKTWSI